MKRRKKLVPLAATTLLAWLVVIWLTFSFPPELGSMVLFFPLVFAATFSFFSLLLNNTRRGLLVGVGAAAFLLLRLFNLTHPFYLAVLVIALVAIELVFRKS